jgi:hypothetical protein
LPARARAPRLIARPCTTLLRDWAAFFRLVVIPPVFLALPLLLDVLFVARRRTATVACPRGAHRVAPLTQAVAQGVDLAADDSNRGCLAGVDKTTPHLVRQLGDLRGRCEDLGALLKQAALAALQLSAASYCSEGERPLHLVKAAE